MNPYSLTHIILNIFAFFPCCSSSTVPFSLYVYVYRKRILCFFLYFFWTENKGIKKNLRLKDSETDKIISGVRFILQFPLQYLVQSLELACI